LKLLKYILVLVVVALLVCAALLYDAANRPFGVYPAGGVFVEIPRGATTRRIARLLAERGVVRSGLAFEALARLRTHQDLKAGEYLFDHAMTADEVFSKLARGDVYHVPLAVPEGLTIFQIAERVAAANLVTREEFLAVARDPAAIKDLAPKAQSLEGFLFPAKYEFPRHVTAAEIAQAMVAAFRREWRSVAAESAATDAPDVLRLVTVASIVERETPAPGERPIVAGVYYNRLKKNIALQCDPTVLYAMDLAGRNDGVINQSDLQMKSPYNTYLNRGLPPGPIGNPGAAALRAALQPAQVDYLYFVANTQGGHFFSRTLQEHARNVARYRQLAGKPPAAASSPAPPPPRKGKGKGKEHR